MRLKFLIKWDMRFLARYGFYFLYGFLTLLYVVLLLSFPQSWKEKIAAILIFSDPAAMGLFFMGAIILLEKSQRVTSLFAVSPLKESEYIGSKVLSISLIAVFVAGALAVVANCKSIPLVLFGTIISSILFTLIGMIIATKIRSLNQFILATVPVELFVFGPAILHLFRITPAYLKFYPANVCMDLIAGRSCSEMGLILTIALIHFLFLKAKKCVSKMWTGTGGVRL